MKYIHIDSTVRIAGQPRCWDVQRRWQGEKGWITTATFDAIWKAYAHAYSINPEVTNGESNDREIRND